jgi:Zn finger protein HypA/HybF involved in hydrogenase expression
MSRLHAHCRNCDCQGPRSEFFRERPGDIPAFGDVCPSCQSENVDVVDPEAAALAARANGGAQSQSRAAA